VPRKARDRHEKRKTFLKRRQALSHFLLQLPNTLLQKIEMGKGLFEQKAMVRFYVSRQSLLELSDRWAQAPTGQLGHLSGVALSRHEGFEHLPGTFAQYISDERTQLDSGGFQDLVDAIKLPIALLRQLGVGAHQIPQLPNGLRGNAAGLEQAVTQQISEPLALFDSGFMPSNGVHMLGIDQQDLIAAFQQIENRAPRDARADLWPLA
jgi:hypothetical protein